MALATEGQTQSITLQRIATGNGSDGDERGSLAFTNLLISAFETCGSTPIQEDTAL